MRLSDRQTDEAIQAELVRRGVLAHELPEASKDLANRMHAIYEVRRTAYGRGYVHWSDVRILAKIVAGVARRNRRRKTFSVATPA